MALYNEAGTLINRAALLALTDADPDPIVTVQETIYEDTQYVGGSTEGGREIKWNEGDQVRMSEIDAAYGLPTVDSIAPATGAAAGGTAVTIKGSHFARGADVIPGGVEPVEGTATVTIGGVACTNVEVVDDETITCVTGAHAAGAVNVVVTTDSGAVTDAAAFTYT